jgi:membrane-associated phospholipid phosphatase
MRKVLPLWLVCILCVHTLFAQSQSHAPTAPLNTELVLNREASLKRLPRDLFEDQVAIWTSPAHLKTTDANWLVPLGIVTGSMIASDRWAPRTLDISPSTQNKFNQFSNAGLAGAFAFSGGTYLLGKIRHNDYQRRAGFLAGEAMVDSAIVGQILKVSFGRERPGEGSMRSKFFQGGNSFPSDHSLLTWSAAAALTEAYPGWGSRILLYGGATSVSLSRILANKHTPSDVLVGSVIGYLIGKKVYRLHTIDREIEEQYGAFKSSPEETEPDAPSRATAYIPMDSWVYDAFDRLNALGYVNTGFLGQRPWTRGEFERLMDEIPENAATNDPVAGPLISALRTELSREAPTSLHKINAELESIYFRATGISGKPLTNDVFFGSTVVNDFGRPFQEGLNGIAGVSGRAEMGPIAFYVRAEYQHAPSAPVLPPSALIAIRNGIDPYKVLPLPPALPQEQIDRVRLLDSYVTWNFDNWQLSFGKQSLWWGPGQSGAMLISNNAEPVTMARLDRTQPLSMPGFLKFLGPMRLQTFVGRLTGQHFEHVENNYFGTYSQPLSDQPYVMGQKISFRLTSNLEIGVTRTSVFGGEEFAITPRRLWSVFFQPTNSNSAAHDPGDRRTGFDFSYRIPGFRKWLTLYNDAMAEDEINPIAYPRRSAMNPGIYMPQLPKLRHMDFRAEAAYTDLPGLKLSDYFYWNVRFISGYTNDGHLMGNWVGRQGKSLQFSSNYYFSGKDKLQLMYRKLAVNPDTGRRGTQHDFRAKFDYTVSSTISTSAWVQYERWDYPVLALTPQSNVSASVQLTYTPHWSFHR